MRLLDPREIEARKLKISLEHKTRSFIKFLLIHGERKQVEILLII